MTDPLALVLYEKLLPGTQIVNRLQDLKYRVQTLTKAGMLVECAQQDPPMLVLADLDANQPAVLEAITKLKQHPATGHLPVIGFCQEATPALQEAAKAASITLLVTEQAIVAHLPQLLDQALQVD